MAVLSFFEWLERTDVATIIRRSPYLIGILSSVHLLGLTLIGGSGIVSCLRCLGFLPEQPLSEIMRPAGNGVVLGFALTLASGFFLFAARASSAVQDPAFQVKMALVLAAAVFHFTVYRTVTRRDETRPSLLPLTGILGLTLWLGVAFAGFAFEVFN